MSATGNSPAIPFDFNCWNPKIPLRGELPVFDVVGRDGLTMRDTIGANNVSILTLTYTMNTLLYGTGGVPERLFDGGSYTLYCKTKIITNVSGTKYWLFWGGNATVARGITIYSIGTDLYCSIGDGTRNYELQCGSNINVTLAGWIEMILTIEPAGKHIYFNMYNCATGASVGTPLDLTWALWDFTGGDNFQVYKIYCANLAYCDHKKFSAVKTIAQCRDNSYITNLQMYHPELITGTDVSGNTHHLIYATTALNPLNKCYSDISTYMLNYGYSRYKSITNGMGYPDIYIPYGVNGLPIDRTGVFVDASFNAYVNVEDHDGNLTNHNLADSYLLMPTNNWDKSDALIYANVVRTRSFYDAANPKRWHISELDYLVFSDCCKALHEGLNFFKITDTSLYYKDGVRKLLIEVFSYATNKTTYDVNTILTYTGDNNAIVSAITLYADASLNAGVINFTISGKIGFTPYKIYYNDGAGKILDGMGLMDNIAHGFTQTYTDILTHAVRIFNPSGLLSINLPNDLIKNFAPLNGNIEEFAKATLLESLVMTDNFSVIWTGSINAFNTTLKIFLIGDQNYALPTNTISGNWNKFVNIENLSLTGHNTTNGNVALLTKLKTLYIAGYSTMDGDFSNLQFITSLECHSFGTNINISGDLSTLPIIQVVCISTNKRVWGNVSAKITLTYLSVSAVPMDVTGSCNLLVSLFYLSVPLTGNLLNCPLLQYVYAYDSFDAVTTTLGLPKLCQFVSQQIMLQAVVDQILNDFWTNRNNTVGVYRILDLIGLAGTQAPSAAGLIVKAALQAYSSPTPPGTAPLWTVTTR
jgi:hypothetical protein